MDAPEIASFCVRDQSDVEEFFANVWRRSRFPFDPEKTHSDLRRIPTVYQIEGGGFWLMRQPQIIRTVAVRR